MKKLSILLLLLLAVMSGMAQRAQMGKLSPMLRHIVLSKQSEQAQVLNAQSNLKSQFSNLKSPKVCAFVRATDSTALADNGCRQLARCGNIYIADIPLDRLVDLSNDDRVLRIEANRRNEPLMDSMAIHLNATEVYRGTGLPQPFTGRGVVMGVMDIGFDLTHPNFYSRDTTDYRIRAFWDMLSADTVGSALPVGRDYLTRSDILNYAHSRDGLLQYHGTHTLGIATGSGYDSEYRGMAPEADICLVSNAVSADTVFIDPADYYKYTFATDVLGFKYIFDYAEAHHQPCVISFSEGSEQDFWGYDQLYYEMLDSLVGPGRILVASAGNQGRKKSWFCKPEGIPFMGTFVQGSSRDMMVTLKSDRDFTIRLVAYAGGATDTLLIDTQTVTAADDSLLMVTLPAPQQPVMVAVEAYPSCYSDKETCYDVTLHVGSGIPGGSGQALSFEVVGTDAVIECYRVNGVFLENSMNPQLSAGECTHNVLSPSSAPAVICVGGTIYRRGFTNYRGEWMPYEKDQCSGGERGSYSSVGPTFDGRVKPDVMAPGLNIISSISSFFMEQNPSSTVLDSDVAHFDFNGRTYGWNSNGGTSMSCPAVAGGIALWLQARPDLSPTDVLGVLSRTCTHYDPSLTYPNNYYGYGEIDVYAGLLDVLGLSGIEELSHQSTPLHVTISEGRLHITLPSVLSQPLQVRLFSLGGQCVANGEVPSYTSVFSMPLPPLSSGYYAVQINGPAPFGGSAIILNK